MIDAINALPDAFRMLDAVMFWIHLIATFSGWVMFEDGSVVAPFAGLAFLTQPPATTIAAIPQAQVIAEGDEVTFHELTPELAARYGDVQVMRFSPESPIGQAAIGKQVGDHLYVDAPCGVRHLVVEHIAHSIVLTHYGAYHCLACEDTGLLDEPDGPDGWAMDFCTCAVGQDKRSVYESQMLDIAERMVEPEYFR